MKRIGEILTGLFCAITSVLFRSFIKFDEGGYLVKITIAVIYLSAIIAVIYLSAIFIRDWFF